MGILITVFSDPGRSLGQVNTDSIPSNNVGQKGRYLKLSGKYADPKLDLMNQNMTLIMKPQLTLSALNLVLGSQVAGAST